jgi:hypothetical protein
MIIEAFTQTYTRLRYLKVASDSISGFMPDGKPASYVVQLTTEAKSGLEAALDQKVTTSQARGALQTVQEAAHDNAVMVHACMKSCFRSDAAAMDSIRGVPTDDKNGAQTLHRMKELSAVWNALPNVPDTTKPFVVRGVTQAIFDQQIEELDAKITAYTKESALLDNEEAKLRVFNARVEDFITAALVQGRAQFAPGTPERALIEAVPTEPSTQRPGQPQFTVSESQADGAVRLEFDADRATSFQVWHKGPGEAQFAQVGDSIRPGNYTAFGLAAGQHEYQIVGVNSRGEGTASEPVSISVAQAAAA